MNKTASSQPESSTGPAYWRSLDQLADTPEFRDWVEREFPSGASEFTDPVNRRHFVKIMSASFLLAGFGLTGCRRPEETILPFAEQPEHYIHGVPQHFATAMPDRASAVPLVVKSSDGRPIKIEGNRQHPDSNGGTHLFAQASILDLYDPDRAQRFTQDGNTVGRELALDFLQSIATRFAASKGQGLAFLTNQSSSPSRLRLEQELRAKMPEARWFQDEAVNLETTASVASRLVGKSVRPFYKLSQARRILTLDFDFVGAEADNARLIRDFSAGRRMHDSHDDMNRLYAVESLMTSTGVSADHRLRVASGGVQAVAAAIAAQLVPGNAAIRELAGKSPLPSGVDRAWVVECAKDLAAFKGQSIVLAGHRQPPAVHAMALLLNAALNNNGSTVFFPESNLPAAEDIAQLAQALTQGRVDTLVILGGNPALTAPADLEWSTAVAQAKNVVRLGYYEDETFAGCHWHLPAAHFLESWGDARTADGTVVPVQPLIQPLFGGLSELEVLARIGGLEVLRPHDIARATFNGLAGAAASRNAWKKFLHDGFLAGSASALSGEITFNASEADAVLTSAAVTSAPSVENLEVVFHRDHKVDDGRYSNNGWLQELPDPLTKITWDNAVLISRKTASELGVRNGDVVNVALGARSIEGPVWVQPGQADYSLGLAVGYGRLHAGTGGTGRVGHQVGMFNAYALRTTHSTNIASGAKLTWTGRTYTVASTQNHGSMEGRPIVREANLDDYKAHPGFAMNMDLESHESFVPKDPKTGRPLKIYENPYTAYEERKAQSGVALDTIVRSDVHQWGMSIDLSACVGCTSCVIACQSENNIPIVGKDQVNRDREMHWIRIDRYFSGAGDKMAAHGIDDPQVINQPMLCQHCEDAPCESVCPVNATVHDAEGLNVMAYNRCVGTRYCSNNCPYKVRRFNFFDYTKHSISDRYKTPLASGHKGAWNLKSWFFNPTEHHTVADDQWELLKLVRNPDVSVRMRGVMEKCTFCVQRIEQAKIAQKNKAGQSGDVRVPDGGITPACEQACPAEAIVFGNLLDPESRVSKLKRNERDYGVLAFLDNRPRVTYLARIRNPNAAMPDTRDNPLNLQEYMDSQHANPFEEHHGAETAPGDAAGKGGAH